MALVDRLRWLVAPVKTRSWRLILTGIVIFMAAVEATMFFQPPRLIAVFLMAVAVAAWFVGACGMVGYFRWFAGAAPEVTRREE